MAFRQEQGWDCSVGTTSGPSPERGSGKALSPSNMLPFPAAREAVPAPGTEGTTHEATARPSSRSGAPDPAGRGALGPVGVRPVPTSQVEDPLHPNSDGQPMADHPAVWSGVMVDSTLALRSRVLCLPLRAEVCGRCSGA